MSLAKMKDSVSQSEEKRIAKAAVLEELQKPLKIIDLEIPELQEGQVLVKIAYSGVCQSQLNEILGRKGADPYLPHTLGHEGSGVILDVGFGVEKVKIGDHVVLSWIKGSGKNVQGCSYIADGQRINSGPISTFLTHAVISENRVIPIPKNFPLREAALLGCAVPTGAGVIFNTLDAQKGKSIAIFGIGGVGSSALLAAQSRGLNPIIAVDVLDSKLEFAKTIGATHTINIAHENCYDKIKQICGGEVVDYAVECAGIKSAMETAYKVTKSNRGVCVLAGNLSKDERIEINPFDLILGKKVIGTWGGESQIDRDVAHYIDLFESNKMNLHSLISKEYPLEKINEAITDIKEGKLIRGLIRC